MANVTIHGMTLLASVATDDELPIYDVSASTTKRATVTSVLGSRLTGTGTIATGTFTGTLPATMTFAGQDVSNTFTKAQTLAPDTTGANGIAITMPASTTGTALVVQQNSNNALRVIATGSLSQVVLDPRALGNNVGGPLLSINRNTNAGAEGPAAGALNLARANGNPTVLWVDSGANLRIHSVAPTGSSGSPTVSDTAGTVVGTQTSALDTKDVIGEFADYDAALAVVLETPLHQFRYKDGRWGAGEEFLGIITDYAPVFGIDRDSDHPAGKSLNEINAHGYALAAIKALAAQVAALQAQIAAL